MATTSTLEEYLETILRLGSSSADGIVRPTDIAEYMDVRAPTVTATLSRLAKQGYIDRVGTGVILTDAGKSYAKGILRRHHVSEEFLVQVLGLPAGTVHQEACELEHAISPRMLDAMETYLAGLKEADPAND